MGAVWRLRMEAKKGRSVETYCTCLGGACEDGPSASDARPHFLGKEELLPDHWTWDPSDKSSEVVLYGGENRTAMFHPGWSNGTAAVKGTKVLNGTRSFWEIQLSHRVFGTSIMFGIGSKDVRNFRGFFTNLIGADKLSWGLSHKGLLWHDNKSYEFIKPFSEQTPTRIGLLFDGFEGTLRYFKDGEDLGVAFRGLNHLPFPVYPIVSSTAARSEIRLASRYRLTFPTLESLCLTAVAEGTHWRRLASLPLPLGLKRQVAELCETASPADVSFRGEPRQFCCPLNPTLPF